MQVNIWLDMIDPVSGIVYIAISKGVQEEMLQLENQINQKS